MKRGKPKPMAEGTLKPLTRRAEQLKVQIRARAEPALYVVKNVYGHRKVRYKRLKKNTVTASPRSPQPIW
jgi:IS5 family transposase